MSMRVTTTMAQAGFRRAISRQVPRTLSTTASSFLGRSSAPTATPVIGTTSASQIRSMTTSLASQKIDLAPKIAAFRKSVEAHLPADGKGVVLATAWIVTDQIILDLLAREFPEICKGMSLVAVDTLHLFPETLDLMRETQARYGKEAKIYLPLGCKTTADFNAKFGHCETTSHDEFDFNSKVEPFQRGLSECEKDILITGRRMDQGSARVQMDEWEPDKGTFNPCAGWSWTEVLQYIDEFDVPYNKRHDLVFRSDSDIPAVERHAEGLPWEVTNLGAPYWRFSEEELAGGKERYYVAKSFGDYHTSVPVQIHESERAGRFVRYGNTECGIHTRAVIKGAPHGGKLVDLYFDGTDEEKKELLDSAEFTFELNERQACDVELLANGGFSPLEGFMDSNTYDRVVEHMRLPELELWGMPITLDTQSEEIAVGSTVKLTYKGQNLAVMTVSDKYTPDKTKEAKMCFGTTSLEHPNVYELAAERGKYYLGGEIIAFEAPARPFPCKTPAEIREEIDANGAKNVVAFQCRNPVHRAHFELFWRIQGMIDDSMVLVHPTCGPTQLTDIAGDVRFHTYEALQAQLKDEKLDKGISWAYLPYSMLLSGPREAIQHMIIRKNFGANHFIIGRDMAGTKSTLDGEDFYGPDDAKEMGLKYQDELGVTVVPFKNMVYTAEEGFMFDDQAKEKGLKIEKLSGTEFRRKLRAGEDIPEWFSFSSVIKVLQDSVKA